MAQTAASPPTQGARNVDPVFAFDDIGLGSEHRRWCNANRDHAQRRAGAIHEAGNALRANIRRSRSWYYVVTKATALAKIRLYHAFLSTLCEVEAKCWMKYRQWYVTSFQTTPKPRAAFDPTK